MAIESGVYIFEDSEDFIKVMEDMQKAYLDKSGNDDGGVANGN